MWGDVAVGSLQGGKKGSDIGSHPLSLPFFKIRNDITPQPTGGFLFLKKNLLLVVITGLHRTEKY